MNILWIPHSCGKGRTRDRYFTERLSEMGHNVHCFVWDIFEDSQLLNQVNPIKYLGALRYWRRGIKGITYHHLPRLVNYWHFLGIYGKWPLINQLWFRNLVKKVVKEFKIEIVICSQSFDPIGLPPNNLGIPLVFDYLDYLDDEIERAYIENSQAVICVSAILSERAKRWSDKVFYVPTGIDLDSFRNANGGAVINNLGLKGKKVISVIGITVHPHFYWLDGIELARKEIPDLKCLFVGDNPQLIPKIKKYLRGKNDAYIFTGDIPYASIPDYFAASDIGMFPGHKDLPGDAACPIKVLEYSACGKPVITPALEELKRWNFPNVIFIDETPQSFAKGIREALTKKFPPADLSQFESNYTIKQLIGILSMLIGR